MSEMSEKPMRRYMAATVVVTTLAVSLMMGAAWANAGAAGDDTVVRDTPPTGQLEKNAPADDGAPLVARPHPRGLPRGAEREQG
jgi:hypothetical protein